MCPSWYAGHPGIDEDDAPPRGPDSESRFASARPSSVAGRLKPGGQGVRRGRWFAPSAVAATCATVVDGAVSDLRFGLVRRRGEGNGRLGQGVPRHWRFALAGAGDGRRHSWLPVKRAGKQSRQPEAAGGELYQEGDGQTDERTAKPRPKAGARRRRGVSMGCCSLAPEAAGGPGAGRTGRARAGGGRSARRPGRAELLVGTLTGNFGWLDLRLISPAGLEAEVGGRLTRA
jgi:hypothetical protein